MTTLKTMIILLLSTAAVTMSGQIQSGLEPETPNIEVTGIAEKEITPDEIYITILIRERHEGKEKITIEKQETDLKDALQNIGVSLDDFSLSDANANYLKIKWTKQDVITKTEYVLKVKDAMTVGKVFKELSDLKIVDARVSKVSHSKLNEFKKEVRIQAITAAKEKADYLLQAVGGVTGKPLQVHELPTHGIDNSNVNIAVARNESSKYYIDGMAMSESDKKKIIQFRKIKLQSAIYVKFEIE